jgi:hypothetical protein
VFGNVGTIISFRVGPFDAEVLETIFTPKFLAPDIVNLGFAQIYLTLMIDGIGSQPFSATTLPPIKPASISAKEMIIHRSRQQFAHKRDEVEKAINEWHLAIEEPLREPRPEVRSSEKTALPPRKDLPPRATAPALVGLPKESSPERPPREQRSSSENRESRRSENAVPQERREQKERHDRTERKERPERTAEASPVRTLERPREVSKAPEERRQSPDPVKSSKSLEDLRSVLRSISSQETPKDQNKPQSKPQEKKEETKREEKKDDSAPVSLRDALSAVLKDAGAQASVEPVVVKTESVPPESQKVIPEEEKPKPPLPPIAENPAPVTSSITSPVPPSVKEDPLSPRKLERMMRVTFSDKNPLG